MAPATFGPKFMFAGIAAVAAPAAVAATDAAAAAATTVAAAAVSASRAAAAAGAAVLHAGASAEGPAERSNAAWSLSVGRDSSSAIKIRSR